MLASRGYQHMPNSPAARAVLPLLNAATLRSVRWCTGSARETPRSRHAAALVVPEADIPEAPEPPGYADALVNG
jgi:hypothetical protein